jgi:hypothetical protein
VNLARDWVQGKTTLRDTNGRSKSLELLLKYVARFQKLLRRPQAQEVLETIRFYAKSAAALRPQSAGAKSEKRCAGASQKKR